MALPVTDMSTRTTDEVDLGTGPTEAPSRGLHYLNFDELDFVPAVVNGRRRLTEEDAVDNMADNVSVYMDSLIDANMPELYNSQLINDEKATLEATIAQQRQLP
ncbi:hypothetical protein HDE_09811 [Halotydeus destructor]|nr:hypothetical protein HDE_09811 [Halotydeus destructor]